MPAVEHSDHANDDPCRGGICKTKRLVGQPWHGGREDKGEGGETYVH